MQWDTEVIPMRGGNRISYNPGIVIRRFDRTTSKKIDTLEIKIAPHIVRKANFKHGDKFKILFSRKERAVGIKRDNYGYSLSCTGKSGENHPGRQGVLQVNTKVIPDDILQLIDSCLHNGTWSTKDVMVSDSTVYTTIKRVQEELLEV